MPYDKPFKTYDEQHQKLVSDYKIISIDKDFEIEILKTFSYYNSIILSLKRDVLNLKVLLIKLKNLLTQKTNQQGII